MLGAILPWKANLEFIAESGGQAFDLARFVADASSTAAARSLSADLLIGATAVTIWICVEGPRQKIKGWWLAIPPELRCGICLRRALFSLFT